MDKRYKIGQWFYLGDEFGLYILARIDVENYALIGLDGNRFEDPFSCKTKTVSYSVLQRHLNDFNIPLIPVEVNVDPIFTTNDIK